MKDELTVIVPVFNEEESLASFFNEMDAFIATTPVSSRVLLVNDGSTDKSATIIREKCNESPHYRTISLDGNYGLSTAIKAGIDNCRTSLVGYIDSDLQTKPQDFLLYFEFFPQYDMVNGIRHKRKDTVVKKLSSKFANAYRRRMINDDILDTCCPLKIMKLSFAKEMPFFTGLHRFMPALVQLQGGLVKQIPIAHYPRYAGTSKYHLWNRLIGPFFDILAFRWMRSRYISYKIADHNR